MKKILINPLLAAILSLSACTMIPDYNRPESPVAENFSGCENKEGKDESCLNFYEDIFENAAQIKWQEFFKSKNMQEIIQTALDNNRDLRIATLNVEAARALYRIEKSDSFPSISATANRVEERSSQNQGTFFNRLTTYNASLNASYEVDLFGKVKSLNKSALETFFATGEARNAAKISLISEVANAYLHLLADQEILQLANESLKDQEKSFELIQKKYERGLISRLDFASSTNVIENAKSVKALYESKVSQDKNALLLLMGVSSSDLIEKDNKLDDVELMDNLPVGLKSSILLLRPDIMRAEHNLKSANANIGAARAAFFPTISLTGSIGYASSNLNNLFSGDSQRWSFAPQITLPIFPIGRNKANLDYAKISKDINVANYEKAIQTAFREVADELAICKSLDEQLRAEYNLAKSAEDIYKISSARYKAGIDNFINVALFQKQMFQAQQNKINLEKEKLANMIRLYKVLGGGVLSANESEH